MLKTDIIKYVKTFPTKKDFINFPGFFTLKRDRGTRQEEGIVFFIKKKTINYNEIRN